MKFILSFHLHLLLVALSDSLLCPQYPHPANGRMICDHLLGKYCTPSCDPGYAPAGPQAWAYVCNPVTQRWATYPEAYPLPWPDCVPKSEALANVRSLSPLPLLNPAPPSNLFATPLLHDPKLDAGVYNKSAPANSTNKLLPVTDNAPVALNSTNTSTDTSTEAEKTSPVNNTAQKPVNATNQNSPSLENFKNTNQTSTSNNSNKTTDALINNATNAVNDVVASAINNATNKLLKSPDNATILKTFNNATIKVPENTTSVAGPSNETVNSVVVPITLSVSPAPPSDNVSYHTFAQVVNNRTSESKVDMQYVAKTTTGTAKEVDTEQVKISTNREKVPEERKDDIVKSPLQEKPGSRRTIPLLTKTKSVAENEPSTFHMGQTSTRQLHHGPTSQRVPKNTVTGVKKEVIAHGYPQIYTDKLHDNNTHFENSTQIENLTSNSPIDEMMNQTTEESIPIEKPANQDVSSGVGSSRDVSSVELELRNITNTLREIGESIKTLPTSHSFLDKKNESLPDTIITNSTIDSKERNSNQSSNQMVEHKIDIHENASQVLNDTKSIIDNDSANMDNVDNRPTVTVIRKPLVLDGLNYQTTTTVSASNASLENSTGELVPVFSTQDLSLLRHMVSSGNNKRSQLKHSSASLWSKMMTLTSSKDLTSPLRKPKLASRKQLATQDSTLAKLIMTGVNDKTNYHFKPKPNPFLYNGKKTREDQVFETKNRQRFSAPVRMERSYLCTHP